MPFSDLTFLLPGQRMEDRPQLTPYLAEDGLASLWARTLHGIYNPIWNGIDFGEIQT